MARAQNKHSSRLRRSAGLVLVFTKFRHHAFVVFLSIVTASYCAAATANEQFEFAKALGNLSITCDTTELASFVSMEEPPEILPLNRGTCETIFNRSGKPDIGAILFSAFSKTEADNAQALSKDERKELIDAEYQQLKTQLRPLLRLCQDLLGAASNGRPPITQGACLFALPRSKHEARALSNRLLQKPEEYNLCAQEPLVAPMRSDHPLKELAGAEPLTWERLSTALAKDDFFCINDDGESCTRFVPMIATGSSIDESALLMRHIRVYRGKWHLSHWNEVDCQSGRERSWCQPDKPPYGDSGGICVEAEDFHLVGNMTVILAP